MAENINSHGKTVVTPMNDGANNPTMAPTVSKIFLTLQEASELSGLSSDYLKKLITDKSLRVIEDTEQKIRRSDLERL